MYRQLRTGELRDESGEDDWPTALAQATYNLNHLHRPQLGGETSASVKRWAFAFETLFVCDARNTHRCEVIYILIFNLPIALRTNQG